MRNEETNPTKFSVKTVQRCCSLVLAGNHKLYLCGSGSLHKHDACNML